MLQETEGLQCETNQIYCWMRCMEYTDTASPEICGAQDLGLKCANPRGEIWVPENSHGDYNPTCTSDTNDTKPVTAAEKIPAKPESCATADFAAYAGAADYQHSLNLGFAGEHPGN
jgi:hypothetical protein